VKRDRTAPEALSQVFALDELHDQAANRTAFLETVDMRNVRMVDRRQHLRFALEPGEPFGVGGKQIREDFDGDATSSWSDRSAPTTLSITPERTSLAASNRSI
jgi:hypothetical protein